MSPSFNYPAVPERRAFTISEAATLALSKPHILRYWEKEIPPLAQVARRNGRRYYNREQVLMLQQINHLLQNGTALAGVSRQLQNNRQPPPTVATPAWLRRELQKVLVLL